MKKRSWGKSGMQVSELGLGCLLVFSTQVFAAGLFDSDEVQTLRLTGPLNTLIRNQEVEQDYAFVLRANGLDHQIMVRARGNSRKRICEFPPLRLEFPTDTQESSMFFGQDDLKLVTHCHRSTKAQADILREFAAYQFFALLSDAAYRVRLLRIAYIDSDGKRGALRYGFLIESTGAVAKRIGGERARLPAVSLKSLNDRQEALVYVFQYLIANTDWSMVNAGGDDECCHNGKLIKKNQQLLYIPYDFDLSGLVNASYAHPDASLRIKRVTQRLYRGFCLDREVLRDAVQTTRLHQGDFVTIIDRLPDLSKGERKKMHRFLDRFFKEANNEEKMLKSFEKRCLN